MLIEKIGTPAMLEQTAEECTELAQACLKLARKYRHENPTLKTEEELYNNFYEELADVTICIEEWTEHFVFAEENINNWRRIKKAKIGERFKND